MSASHPSNPQPLIVNIGENPEPIRVESLCIKCGSNGQTILLMTKIPFFKDVLISSFICNDCGNKNNETKFVGELPSKGVSINFKATHVSDLNREIIKSEHASIKFEELGLEIPETNRAEINTIEGMLMKVQEDLQYDQEERKRKDPESFAKINEFIQKIRQYREGKVLPFNVKVYDPSGNSNVKNPFAPKLDERIFISYFTRTIQQLTKMGYNHENIIENTSNNDIQNGIKKVDFTQGIVDKDFMHQEASIMQVDCHVCMMPGQMKFCQTNIPHFADLIIMSFSCDYCGAHNTETKNSGAISEKCTTIQLNAFNEVDLKRDLFKSQTCNVKIPELELELDYGTLGGVLTTVEGLLQKISTHMKEINPFSDSDDDLAQKMLSIINSLEDMRNAKRNFTLILEDPLSNSFIQNPYHPEADKNAIIQTRDRTEDEIDYLGINEMHV